MAGKLLLWLVIGAVMAGLFHVFAPGQIQNAAHQLVRTACDPSRGPVPNRLVPLAPGDGHLKRNALVVFRNNTYSGKHLRFDVPGSSMALYSVYLAPATETRLSMPFGQYVMSSTSEGTWCNQTIGFEGAPRIVYNPPLALAPHSTTTLTISDRAGTGDGYALTVASGPGDVEVENKERMAGAVMQLARAADGHFYISGYANGFPLVFMVDTGATTVALPMSMARNVGVGHCRQAVTATANGQAKGCVAEIRAMKVGPFEFANVSAFFAPGLATPLLGQNVINSLNMQTQGDSLYLSLGN